MTELTNREQYIVALIMGMRVMKETNIQKKIIMDIMTDIRKTMYPDISETEMYEIIDGLDKIEQKLTLTMNAIRIADHNIKNLFN